MARLSDMSELEVRLNDFDAEVRSQAIQDLASLQVKGEIELSAERDVANMHCHTFFSYNAYGYSPSGLAWLGKEQGYKLMGTVDFDVLDAVDEFLDGCDLVGLRGSAGIETRAYIPEFETRVINSPGEPGVIYHMGIGFTSSAVPDSVAELANAMRERARRRNLGMVDRVNAYLDPVVLGYEQDVLPLTPKGNATERHMVVAYVEAARRTVADPAAFWADKLAMDREDVVALMADSPAFQNSIRSKLMKRGGVGYVQPSPESFATIEEFHTFIQACGALPCAAWLDGTTAGEKAMEELLALLIGKGVVTLNIVPDRNWNIADPDVKALKVAELYKVVELAQKLDLPLNVGTEMNSFGNKLVDDFDAPELASIRQAFLEGAYFIYGHTQLQRSQRLGYQSEWTKSHLPTRAERNTFYTLVGKLTPPGALGLSLLETLSSAMTPDQIIATLHTT